MLKSSLLEIIAHGENSGTEFKRDDLRPEQLAKEIVALVNFQGGKLILGVEDDGSISGITRSDLETWIMDTVINRYVHPQILPYYEEVKLDNDQRVAVLTVTTGTAKPYVVRHHDREEIYIRVGSTSQRATREQQARLFESGGLLHSEILPVSGSHFDHLDIARLKDYFLNVIGESELPNSSYEWEQRLCGLGLMTLQNNLCVCTVAGVVLFARGPRHLLRQAGIRWMVFSGNDKTYQAIDDTMINYPLVGLFEGKSGSGRRLIEPGLIERLLDRIQPFVSMESSSLVDGVRHERLWYYSPEVIREAAINAVIHRDWTRSIEVEMCRYSDRLEIISPGVLQNSMTIEKMIAGQRMPRNPVIAEIMRDYGYVEARGMGVRRKIIPLTKEYTGQEPQFVLTDDYLQLILPAKSLNS